MAVEQLSASPDGPVELPEQLNVRERSEYLGNLIYRHIFEIIKSGEFSAGDRLPTEIGMHPRSKPRAPRPDVFISVAAPRLPTSWLPYLARA